jgi:release factor glutamine methyltransferase
MPAEAREHEPRTALDGGADGLDVARRVLAGAGEWLAPGGCVLFEIGEVQRPATTEIVSTAGLVPRIAEAEDTGATVVIGARV